MQNVTEKLIGRKDGAVGRVIFNNPQKRNAVSLEMWQALAAVLEEFTRDPAIRVVVLSGAGDKAFVSGADISEFEDKRATLDAIEIYENSSQRAARALRECPKPTMAMIRGYCIGGGLGTAVNCDLRIAADDSRFGIPAARLGVGYRYERLKQLADLVGPAFAAEIFYTGRQFDAQEALQMRLVNRVLPAAELEQYVLEYAAAIAANAPLTIASVKRSLIEIAKDPGERDIAACGKMVDACFSSQDYIEGRTAFTEKRKPVFQGH